MTLSKALLGVTKQGNSRFKKVESFYFSKTHRKDGGGPNPLLLPRPHFPQAPPRALARRNGSGRAAATAHAQHVVTRAPRTARCWREGGAFPASAAASPRVSNVGFKLPPPSRGSRGFPKPSEGRPAARPWDCADPGDRRELSGPGPECVSSGGPRPPARGARAPTAVAGAAAGGGGGGQDHVGPPLRRRGRGLRGRGGGGHGAGRPRAVRGVPQRGRGASQEAGDAREGEQPRHGGQEVHAAPLRRR